MSKKIFCDSCGDEFDYKSILVESANHNPREVKRGRFVSGARPIAVEVIISVRPLEPTEKEHGYRHMNEEHFDLCGKCRWDLVDTQDPRPGLAKIDVEN